MVERCSRDLALKTLSCVSHFMALEGQQVDRDLENRVRTYTDTALRDRDLRETA
jgi:hypothetical protein